MSKLGDLLVQGAVVDGKVDGKALCEVVAHKLNVAIEEKTGGKGLDIGGKKLELTGEMVEMGANALIVQIIKLL